METYTEEQKEGRRAAMRRWRERNPEKVQAANRKPRTRAYDPVKTKEWRVIRLADPAYKERINKEANDRATKIRLWLSNYKASIGCADCGFNDPRALDFDHIGDDKSLNVSFAKSIGQAKKEIAKCVVRCSNCHRIITHIRLQQNRK